MNFSVVLPVYNVGKYIERCLLSLQSQAYKNFEMVFVDDCGDDNSIDIVSNYAKNDDRIRIVKNSKNLGTYHARRVGVENAKGKYIVFLDPDDELEPEALNILSSKIVNKPDVVFFGSRRVPAPKPWQSSPQVPKLPVSASKQEMVLKITECKALAKGTEGKAFERHFLNYAYNHLGIPLSNRLVYGEDKLLFFAVLLNLSKAVSVSDDLYVYHKNDTSITIVDSANLIALRAQQLKEVMYYIVDVDTDEEYLLKFKNHLITELTIDILRLRLIGEISFTEKLMLHWKVFNVSKNPKELIRLLFFLITIGRVSI